MEALGVRHTFAEEDGRQRADGSRPRRRWAFRARHTLDAGNSGSTIRMLSGFSQAQPFATTITGDESLVKRPMRRIMAPLAEMNAQIEPPAASFLRLPFTDTALRGIDYNRRSRARRSRAASSSPDCMPRRNHSPRAGFDARPYRDRAARAGADISLSPRLVRVQGGGRLTAKRWSFPRSLFPPSFFIVAALIAAPEAI